MKIDIMQLEFINNTLRKIVTDLELHFGEQVITSLYRINDNGVHGTLPLRAIDVRCRYWKLGVLIEECINERWIYDTERPNKKVCKFHNVGNLGWHLHIQVHANTKKI